MLHPPVRLGDGEHCHLQTGFVSSVYATADVRAPGPGFSFAWGSPLLVAATIGGRMLYNAHQQTQARMASAAQWRLSNEGTIFLTNRRVCLQGRLGWVEIGYEQILSLEPLPDGVVVYQAQLPPLKLVTSWLEYFYVMVSWLAFGRKVPFTLDPEVEIRAKATGAINEGRTV
jgi:hypothetical protein